MKRKIQMLLIGLLIYPYICWNLCQQSETNEDNIKERYAALWCHNR